MMGALYSGITGIQANGDIMNILGNNIANLNTVGFKKSNGTFFDILSTNLVGGGSSMQIGRGTYMGTVMTDFLQGAFEQTESVTDLAVEGDGFFVLRDPSPTDDRPYYTRNGQFIIDKGGYLTSTDGMRVQGYMIDSGTGLIDYTQEADIQLANALTESRTTAAAELGLNLDADSDIGKAGEYSTTLSIYDSQGREIPLSNTFRKTGTNAWEIIPSIPDTFGSAGFGAYTPVAAPESATPVGGPPTNVFTLANDGIDSSTMTFTVGGAPQTFTVIHTGTPTVGQVLVTDNGAAAGTTTLTFNPAQPAPFLESAPAAADGVFDGALTVDVDYSYYADGYSIPVTFDAQGNMATLNGAAVPPSSFPVTLNLTVGSATQQTIDVDVTDMTQYASASTTKKLQQDGFGAGELSSIEVSKEGYITGHYTNGLSEDIARLFLGDFRSPQGLSKVGETRYVATRESGQAIHNVPGTGLNTIDSYSLEQANVDMASEFVKIITAQRAYTANTKVVSTADSMLSDLMNMKR